MDDATTTTNATLLRGVRRQITFLNLTFLHARACPPTLQFSIYVSPFESQPVYLSSPSLPSTQSTPSSLRSSHNSALHHAKSSSLSPRSVRPPILEAAFIPRDQGLHSSVCLVQPARASHLGEGKLCNSGGRQAGRQVTKIRAPWPSSPWSGTKSRRLFFYL